MQVTRNEDGSFTLGEIEPPLDLLLQAIPGAADPGDNSAARRRLYPDPAADETLVEEWAEYVRPGLEEVFRDASNVVETDLKQLDEGGTLAIAPAHVEAWLSALNQARLVLAARHEITEADMERPVAHLVEEGRDLALFQIHLYGFLQECLVRGLESED